MFSKNNNYTKRPKIDTCKEVQQFIDEMCEEYQVPPIKVIIRSTNWVEWFAGKGVIACAFWPNEGEEDAGFGRYIVFDGQKCRISGKERNPVKIEYRYQTVERIHTIIHEFIHHYFHHHEGVNTSNHGRKFRQMEKKMNANYGIFFSSIRGISMQNFFTTFGASRLAKKGQVQLTEVVKFRSTLVKEVN